VYVWTPANTKYDIEVNFMYAPSFSKKNDLTKTKHMHLVHKEDMCVPVSIGGSGSGGEMSGCGGGSL
jgi:hypothetical protein